ncbi:MAG: hypothetical protein GWP18_04025 [Proteobacteria bacterium]|nr:hypothetical protein [Pseudomonadota bacterium]
MLHLVKLYTGRLQYDAALDAAVHSDESGYLFGNGSGDIDWDGTPGTVTWSNFPTVLPRDVIEPRVTGAIHLASEDLPILFELSGIAHPQDTKGSRLIVASVRWHTASESFAWLNTSVGVEHGVLDASTGSITTTYVVDPD